MTLPNVSLGNTLSDVGSGANSFASGLMAQRARQQQIALQEGLAKSKMALDTQQGQHLQDEGNLMEAQGKNLAATTENTNEQERLREHLNQPADDSDLHWVKQYWPHMTMDHLQGMNKSDVHDLVKNGALYARMQASMAGLGMRQQSMFMTGGNSAYNRFVHHPDYLRASDAKDAFDNLAGLLRANNSIGYNEVFGSLARMALPNNARAVGQMLTKLSQTGVLKGPFNPAENVLLTLNRLSNTQGTLPLTPQMKQEIWNDAKEMLTSHMQKHDVLKKTIQSQMAQSGLPFGDDFLESEDKFADVRALQQNPRPQAGQLAPGTAPVQPTAPQGVNPRFMPNAARTGPR